MNIIQTVLSILADGSTFIGVVLALWEWIADRSRPRPVKNLEDALDKAGDETGYQFEEYGILREGPISYLGRKLRRWKEN
jgi:hypothetical protein